MSSDEEGTTVQCLNCLESIGEKPWMSVEHKGAVIHSCSYLCTTKLHEHIGSGYWKNVINKEDFPEPRPLYSVTSKKVIRKDITTGFGLEEIRAEIEKENARVLEIEDYYENESSDYESNEEDYL